MRSATSRQALDARLDEFRPTHRFDRPVRGWVRAIRDALHMSTGQLAKRLKIKQPTVVAIEQSEMKGTIQLATLRRVAEALDCTLVYALVPNQTLERTVQERARMIARRHVLSVQHSMRLENQIVRSEDSEAHVEALARGISPRRLWNED
ncbi:MAG TPA: mobile mystery protein A [Gemmatimonadaceae bacterium]|nr:mobile mystery protein A [Gemmatimonadaceae bacterium]